MSMDTTLLVSIHDVSPLTLEACQRAALMLNRAGLPTTALTLLVIPNHEGRADLALHPSTCDWLRAMGNAGATLVMHGYAHRMPGPAFLPWDWPKAYGFARGQGEFAVTDVEETRERIAAGQTILQGAGLASALHGFVPPAWLASKAATRVIRSSGFSFVEYFSGIEANGKRHARKVIGLGSLSAIEAWITAAFATIEARRATADTRLAIHPADMDRPYSARAMEKLFGRLREKFVSRSYADFLATRSELAHTQRG